MVRSPTDISALSQISSWKLWLCGLVKEATPVRAPGVPAAESAGFTFRYLIYLRFEWPPVTGEWEVVPMVERAVL